MFKYLKLFKKVIKIQKKNNIPYINLEEIHIKNLKILLNRISLLRHLPQNSVIAEIGVADGNYTEKILKIANPKKMILIDQWGNKRYNIRMYKGLQNKYRNEILNNKIEIKKGLSIDVLKEFTNNYFDWVYLDTDHSYKNTLAELNILKNKVKTNGLICGHDYTVGSFQTFVKYGVIEAVNEFCVKNNWELIFLTNETNRFLSYAIKRI